MCNPWKNKEIGQDSRQADKADLMDVVTEADKAWEASPITRREETAAMRSQANTAKIRESNPTLMRLPELEVLGWAAG